jgi:ribosomal protein S18 acetylase RimI-like enzyme
MPDLSLPARARDVPGLRLRPFAGAADFPEMARVANASFAADGIAIVRSPKEMQRDYESFPRCDPARDVVMAEVDGELVGYVRSVGWWTLADGTHVQGQLGLLAPQWRRRGIGSALLAWLEARQREIALEHPGASGYLHHVFVTQAEAGRAAMLAQAGYGAVRHFYEMVQPDLEQLPEFALPAGFEVRPVRQQDLRAIFDAHMDALRGHWGFAPPQPEEFDQWCKAPTCQPHLWQVAWDVETGQVAGQVKPWINATQNEALGRRRGYTEFISVGVPWRRRGLARALVARALRALRDAGMTDSELGVDSDSPFGAPRLYEACGFRVVRRNAVWRKPMQFDAGSTPPA